MNIKKLAPLAAVAIALAASISFAPAAQAANPAEVVFSPSISVAEDGSYTYVPGEFSGDVSTLAVAWYSCPTAQLGAIGDATELAQQLTDAGCSQVSTDSTVPADTFDNITSFPVIIEIANETTAAYMGNSFIMYDKGVGPIAYSFSGASLARTIYFAGNSATLNSASRAALYALLSKVGSTSTAVVTINAYAAKGGSAAKNAAIARGRARQIMFFFKKNGIYGPFKIKLHTSTVSGVAGRKATVKLQVIDPMMPQ